MRFMWFWIPKLVFIPEFGRGNVLSGQIAYSPRPVSPIRRHLVWRWTLGSFQRPVGPRTPAPQHTYFVDSHRESTTI